MPPLRRVKHARIIISKHKSSKLQATVEKYEKMHGMTVTEAEKVRQGGQQLRPASAPVLLLRRDRRSSYLPSARSPGCPHQVMTAWRKRAEAHKQQG